MKVPRLNVTASEEGRFGIHTDAYKLAESRPGYKEGSANESQNGLMAVHQFDHDPWDKAMPKPAYPEVPMGLLR